MPRTKLTQSVSNMLTSTTKEERELQREISYINNLLVSMSRSSYFFGISFPEPLNRKIITEKSKTDFSATKQYLDAIKGTLSNIWNERRSETAVENRIGIVYSEGSYRKVLNIDIPSSIKRSERTGRGTLSEKASRTLIADDMEMLKRLTKKSDSEIMNFLNLWYENPEVSGGQLLEKFVDGVYKSEYSGQGASQSWGSPPVRMIIEERIIDAFNIEMQVDDENISASWETESKMGNELFDAWMNLFS